ncbi:MAG: glycosyltransferase [Ignavibacteriae bacterium]|nr:glycosyltransferase [Ignavibacteriota bacterium]
MGGDRIRIYHCCRVLAQQYEAELLVINEGKVQQEYVDEIKKLGVKVTLFEMPSWRCKVNVAGGVFSSLPLQVRYYYFKKVQSWLDEHVKEFDVVLCNHIRSAEYLKSKKIKKILDLHDAISLNYSRASEHAKGIWKWIYSVENNRVLPYEIDAVNSFDASLIVSPIDKLHLGKHGADEKKITVLPVAVDDKLFHTRKISDEKNWAVFVGKMNTVANSDAAVYFATEIFPLIRKQQSDAEFYIVGADPTTKVTRLSQIPGVHVTGQVADHLEYVLKAKVAVDPMRFGAGMQNKILEAFALRKPVVATSLAVEGIEGKKNEHFLVADSPNDFADAVCTLFKDEQRRRQLGEAGRELVLSKYSWDTVGDSLLRIVEQTLKS